MMKKRELQPLTFDKILLQPDFIGSIENKNKKIDLYGKEEIEKDESLRHELEKASFIYQILTSHKKVTYSDDIKKQQTNRLIVRIKTDEKSKQGNSNLFLLKIAASAVILVAFSLLILKRDMFMLSERKVQKLELIVPSGEKSQLILADGTQVWVNSESRLIYPVNFKSRERKILLEGEAYFDVSKVNNSQFIVYTQDVMVKVMGTKFNVKSYPKDRTIETTVVEGLVRVEDEVGNKRFSPTLLKTADKMVIRKDYPENQSPDLERENGDKTIQKSVPVAKEEILIRHVNTENITSWKDHLLVFDNETLEEIALKMSRWYKVQVDILDADLKSHRYTGKFVNNESLDQVLEAINLTTPIQYNINKNSVQIRFKSKK